MMKKSLLAILAVMLLAVPVMGCLNGFSDLFGHQLEKSRGKFPVPLGHPIKIGDRYGVEMGEAEDGYKRGRFENSIDYGLFLVYQEKYEEAEAVFRKAAEKWPNKYEAASNFGTILEVNGKTEEALKWIQKAIEIDPKSHDGSEWIHVKILEAKLKGGVVSGSAMTGVDFGSADAPASNKPASDLKQLQKQLFYQLNERITFIAPKDPYIAALMMELGNVTLALDQRKAAKDIYTLARKYGFAGDLLDKRTALASKEAPLEPASVDTAPSLDAVTEVAAADTQPVVAAMDTPTAQNGPGIAPIVSGKSYFFIATVAVLVAVVGLGIGILVRALRKRG